MLSCLQEKTEVLVNLSKRSSSTDGHRNYNFSTSPTFSQSLTHGAINGQDYPQTPNSRFMAYPTAHQDLGYLQQSQSFKFRIIYDELL